MPDHQRNVALAVAAAVDGRPYYVIAAEAGVNASDFSAIVHGRKIPSAQLRARIAAALGVAEDELFGDDVAVAG
jgi:transcriptional regulator with XRE-family HTH domain